MLLINKLKELNGFDSKMFIKLVGADAELVGGKVGGMKVRRLLAKTFSSMDQIQLDRLGDSLVENRPLINHYVVTESKDFRAAYMSNIDSCMQDAEELVELLELNSSNVSVVICREGSTVVNRLLVWKSGENVWADSIYGDANSRGEVYDFAKSRGYLRNTNLVSFKFLSPAKQQGCYIDSFEVSEGMFIPADKGDFLKQVKWDIWDFLFEIETKIRIRDGKIKFVYAGHRGSAMSRYLYTKSKQVIVKGFHSLVVDGEDVTTQLLAFVKKEYQTQKIWDDMSKLNKQL